MSIPGFSEFPEIPQRSTPEADFDAKMYALFQHFAITHRNELLTFIDFLENNSTVINAALNATTIGLTVPAAGKFTELEAQNITGAAVQSDVTDAGSGKILKVAAFGLGSKLLQSSVHVLKNMDALNIAAGLYGVTSVTTGERPVGASEFGVLQVLPLAAGDQPGVPQITQIYWPSSPDPAQYIRHYRGGSDWSAWGHIRLSGVQEGSLGAPAFAQNNSSVTLAYGDEVDGGDLRTASSAGALGGHLAGRWKCYGHCQPSQTAIFERVL